MRSMDGLSNGRAAPFKCTSEGNTLCHIKSMNPTHSLPLHQLIRDPSRSHRLPGPSLQRTILINFCTTLKMYTDSRRIDVTYETHVVTMGNVSALGKTYKEVAILPTSFHSLKTHRYQQSQISIKKSSNAKIPTTVNMECSGEERGSPEPELGEDEIEIRVYIGDIPFNPHSQAPDAGSLEIPIHKDATLEDLKSEIQKRYLGLEPYFQILLFKGDVMTDDERKLSEYGIDEDNSELELETAKICEECGGRVYKIGDQASEKCENCDENMETEEGV